MQFRRAHLLSTLVCATAMLSAPQLHANSMIDQKTVQLRALDKITARTVTFEADVGTTVKFGSLFIKAQACRKAPPIEPPESAAFLQIWEAHQSKEKIHERSADLKQEWVFSGWMFASSPALSYMDHPIYDVWVLDCLEQVNEAITVEGGELLEGEGEIIEEQLPEVSPEQSTIDDIVAQPAHDRHTQKNEQNNEHASDKILINDSTPNEENSSEE